MIAVDLTGPWLCSQAAARQMVKQGGGGRIINISSARRLTHAHQCSILCREGWPSDADAYDRGRMAPHNITVNNIGPGAIYTPIDKNVEANPTLNRQLMAEIPLGRWGRPEEVAGLALYLASDAAGYVTGSTHFIDGGMLRYAGSL